MSKCRDLSDKLEALLRMGRRTPVGVKLTNSEDEHGRFAATELRAPLKYCVAVSSASLGYSVKFTSEMSGCGGSTRALGFAPPGERYFSGEEGCDLGLFKDKGRAADVCSRMKILKQPPYGAVVKPLSAYSDGEPEPDVVIVVLGAREMMRLVQGITCASGMQDGMNITGNQALCVECTAFPMITGKPNLSFFCSGTRYIASWDETETAAGIPFEMFESVVQGVLDTADGTEMDERKAEIARDLAAIGCDAPLRGGWAYYLREQKGSDL